MSSYQAVTFERVIALPRLSICLEIILIASPRPRTDPTCRALAASTAQPSLSFNWARLLLRLPACLHACLKWGQVEEQRGKIPTADCSLGLPPKEKRQWHGSVDLTMLAMTVAVIERSQVKVEPREGETKAWHTQHVPGVGGRVSKSEGRVPEESSRVGEECSIPFQWLC